MHWKSQLLRHANREITVDRVSRLTLIPFTIASLFGLILVVSIIRQPAAPQRDNENASRDKTSAHKEAISVSSEDDASQHNQFLAPPPSLSEPLAQAETPLPHNPTPLVINAPLVDVSANEAGADTDGKSADQGDISDRATVDLTDLVRQAPNNLPETEFTTSPSRDEISDADDRRLPALHFESASDATGLQLEAPRTTRSEGNQTFTTNITAPGLPQQSAAGTESDQNSPPASRPSAVGMPPLKIPEQPSNLTTGQLPARPIVSTQRQIDPPSSFDFEDETVSGYSSSFPESQSSEVNDPQLNTNAQVTIGSQPSFERSQQNPIEERLPEQVVAPIAQRVEHGKQLAGKGALFSARDEFQHALYLIANARSTLLNSNEPTRQLDAAMIAMREADEFARQQNDPNFQLNLASISASHQTPVLKQVDIRSLSTIEVTRLYYEFAGQNMIDAMGSERIAADSLFSLGKLHIMQHGLGEHGVIMPVPKALVFFQSAVMIDSSHHRAANELGVQLARLGEFEGAREALLMSVATQPSLTTWRNLAFVHRQLNEGELAQLAENEAMLLERQMPGAPSNVASSPNGSIEFVPSSQFGESGPPTSALNPMNPNAAPVNPARSQGENRAAASRKRFLGVF